MCVEEVRLDTFHEGMYPFTRYLAQYVSVLNGFPGSLSCFSLQGIEFLFSKSVQACLEYIHTGKLPEVAPQMLADYFLIADRSSSLQGFRVPITTPSTAPSTSYILGTK